MTILRLIAKEKGHEKEELTRLFRLASKKIEKGYTIEELAELFEKPKSYMGAIYTLIKENPGMDGCEWYELLVGEERQAS